MGQVGGHEGRTEKGEELRRFSTCGHVGHMSEWCWHKGGFRSGTEGEDMGLESEDTSWKRQSPDPVLEALEVLESGLGSGGLTVKRPRQHDRCLARVH